MSDLPCLRMKSARRGVAPWSRVWGCAALLVLAGCAYSERQPLQLRARPPGDLIALAMDPLRPLPDRLAAAEELDPAGRRALETRLLEDLPELWGLEWRERLALLGVVGSARAAQELESLQGSDRLPNSRRIRGAIEQAVERIDDRLDGATASLDVHQDS